MPKFMRLRRKAAALAVAASIGVGGSVAAAVVTDSTPVLAATCSGGWVPGYYGHQAYGYCYSSTTSQRYRIVEIGYNGVYSYGRIVGPGYTAVGTYRTDSLKSWYLQFV